MKRSPEDEAEAIIRVNVSESLERPASENARAVSNDEEESLLRKASRSDGEDGAAKKISRSESAAKECEEEAASAGTEQFNKSDDDTGDSVATDLLLDGEDL